MEVVEDFQITNNDFFDIGEEQNSLSGESTSTPPDSPDSTNLFEFAGEGNNFNFSSGTNGDSSIFVNAGEWNQQSTGQSIFDNTTPLTDAQLNQISSTMITQETPIIAQPQMQVVDVISQPSSPPVLELVDDEETIKATKKRGRKKRKVSEDDYVEVKPAKSATTKDISPVTLDGIIPEGADGKLSRDQLLNLSSAQFEEYYQKVLSKKDLSNEEKKELKRQRRLIKNRESAQASRQRKKNYVDELEQKVQQLQDTNSNLKEKLVSMQSENSTLKEEVLSLKNMIKKTPGLATLFNTGVRYLAKQQPNVITPENTKLAGVVLMVLLFSFGLFFPQLQQLQRGSGGISTSQPQLTYTSQQQHLHNNQQSDVPSVIPQHHGMYIKASSGSNNDLGGSNFNSKRLEDAANKRRQQQQPQPTQTIYNNGPQVTPLQSEKVNHTTTPHLNQPYIENYRPNTTYMLCEKVQQMHPPSPVPRNDNEPSLLSLIIPGENLGGASDQFVEITCSVLDANIIPLLQSQKVSSTGGVGKDGSRTNSGTTA